MCHSYQYSPLPNCREVKLRFLKKIFLISIYYNPLKLRNSLKVLTKLLRHPLTIVTPPIILNVGPETLFRGAWKRDTKIVMQELNKNLSGTRKYNVNQPIREDIALLFRYWKFIFPNRIPLNFVQQCKKEYRTKNVPNHVLVSQGEHLYQPSPPSFRLLSTPKSMPNLKCLRPSKLLRHPPHQKKTTNLK